MYVKKIIPDQGFYKYCYISAIPEIVNSDPFSESFMGFQSAPLKLSSEAAFNIGFRTHHANLTSSTGPDCSPLLHAAAVGSSVSQETSASVPQKSADGSGAQDFYVLQDRSLTLARVKPSYMVLK